MVTGLGKRAGRWDRSREREGGREGKGGEGKGKERRREE